MQVQALQDKLDSLLQGFEAVTTAQPRALEQPTGARCLQDDHEITVDHDLGSPDVASSSSNREDVPQFHGPTTAAFAFERARSSLRGSGLGGLTVTDEAAEIPSSESTASPWKPSFDHQSSSNTLEPALVEIGEAEILRLCHNYDNKFGLIYPVVDITALTSKFRTCFTQQRSGRSDPRVRFYNSADQILPHDIAVLKVVLATSLAVEGGGRSDQGRQLFESAQDSIQGLMWQPAGLWSIQLLTLAVSRSAQVTRRATTDTRPIIGNLSSRPRCLRNNTSSGGPGSDILLRNGHPPGRSTPSEASRRQRYHSSLQDLLVFVYARQKSGFWNGLSCEAARRRD